MEPEDYLIWLYLEVEALFKQVVGDRRLRESGPMPRLSDVEVITIELFGEYQGHGNDKAIWRYIHDHWISHFPALGSYKNFAKHCANLMVVKEKMMSLLTAPADNDQFYIVDGVPVPVCKFARARRCKLFRGIASFGYCAAKAETFYGFKGHLVIAGTGAIRGFNLTPANGCERQAVLEMDMNISGDMLADKGYLGKDFSAAMKNEHNIIVHTPLRDNMPDARPKEFLRTIMNKRRYIESVLNKLIDQFSLIQNKARDIWHLSNKIFRKLLSFSLALKFHGSTQFLT